MMKAQDPRGGRIINNGSFRRTCPGPFRALYGDQARDHRPYQSRRRSMDATFDIACGQIDIGNAATDMTAR